MKEISCNVIKDLMPSYIDEICSEESRSLVDEHLKNCEQCRTQFEMLKSIVLTDEKGEHEKISYLKKVKRHYVNKEIISLIFLVIAFMGEYRIMMRGYITVLFILFPLLVFASYCLMPGNLLSAKHTKMSGILVMISIVLVVYFSVLVYWCILITRTGKGLFGIPVNETGPFLGGQCIFIFIMQNGIFVLSNIFILKGFFINKLIYGLSLTGANLAAVYVCVLQNMSTPESFYMIICQVTLRIIIEGIVFSIAACIFAKKVVNLN